jgi:hypothetical protein
VPAGAFVRFKVFPPLFDQEYEYGCAPPFMTNPVIEPGVKHVAFVIVGTPVIIGEEPMTTETGLLKEPGQIPT